MPLTRAAHPAKTASKCQALLAETGTSLTDLPGIGPSGAARLLVEIGDITLFPNRDRFASCNGTASSADADGHFVVGTYPAS